MYSGKKTVKYAGLEVNTTQSIVVQNLKKTFHDQSILKGIHLDLPSHELTVLIGPSGAGKSTLLRCLNGLEVFDEGIIKIAGVELERKNDSAFHDKTFHQKTKEIRKRVGMVFQSFNLFPHLTVLQNITLAPVIVKNIPEKEAEEEARQLLDKVGLFSRLHHYPIQLSGGQQQRAAIARALAMHPQVLLYDEPTSSLDPGLVDEVLLVMKKLHDEGMTQIVVTHHMRFAKDVADRIIYIDDGQVVETASPETIFASPSDERTRKFLKKYI